MIINQSLLDNLTAQAVASPRLRKELDLRNTVEDGSQRMLVAIEPGSKILVHRHTNTSKTVVMVRGHLLLRLFDASGQEQERIDMYPIGAIPSANIAIGQWHTLESLESGTVVFIAKDGPYEALTEEDILDV